MNQRGYLVISGTLFLIFAVVHVLRLFSGWEVVFNGATVPMGVSYVALAVSGLLAIWAFRLAKSR